MTEGLDGLRDRLKEYAAMGARFAKWRAVIRITEALPSSMCVKVNAHALARYAALCQEQGIVPIVEPEVLMDGSHTIERCEEVTSSVLHAVFDALFEQCVRLEGMLLKPNMVIAGKVCPKQASVQEVATATLRCLRRHVPAAVPGIVFLSGGQPSIDGDRASRCHQSPERTETLDDQFFIRPRPAGRGAGGLARTKGKLEGGPTGLPSSGQVQQRGGIGPLYRQAGARAVRCE